jgi:hypothetical protein
MTVSLGAGLVKISDDDAPVTLSKLVANSLRGSPGYQMACGGKDAVRRSVKRYIDIARGDGTLR